MLFLILHLIHNCFIYVTYELNQGVTKLTDITQLQHLKRRRQNVNRIKNYKINSSSLKHRSQRAVLFLPCRRGAKIYASSTTGHQVP